MKAENMDQFDKDLKAKISPAKEKINVTFYKKVNSNTAVINTASKEESIKLTKIINDRSY